MHTGNIICIIFQKQSIQTSKRFCLFDHSCHFFSFKIVTSKGIVSLGRCWKQCTFKQVQRRKKWIRYSITIVMGWDDAALINIPEPHFWAGEVHYTHHQEVPQSFPQQYKCCELETKQLRHWTATSPSGWTFTDRSQLLLPRLQQLSCSTSTPCIMKETSLHLCHPDISWLQTRIASLGRPNMTSILMQSVCMQVRRWVMKSYYLER